MAARWATATVATLCAVALAGCGDVDVPDEAAADGAVEQAEPLDSTGFEPVSIEIDGLSFATDVDSVTLVRMQVFDGGDELLDEPIVTTEGEPCESAADPVACSRELAALIDGAGELPHVLVDHCWNCESTKWAVITTGTAGARAVPPETVADVLAPIDTPLEAIVVYGDDAWVKSVDDGWEVFSASVVEDCDPVVTRSMITSVTTTGKVRDLRYSDRVDEGVCI